MVIVPEAPDRDPAAHASPPEQTTNVPNEMIAAAATRRIIAFSSLPSLLGRSIAARPGIIKARIRFAGAKRRR
jgi:hypothetical protein